MKKIENNYIARSALFKKIFKEASKNLKCPHCRQMNPVIQKLAKISGKIEVRHAMLYLLWYVGKGKSWRTRSKGALCSRPIRRETT